MKAPRPLQLVMGLTLTGYGGVGEIGGNAFRLDAGRSSLFLDFGKRFGNDKRVESAGARPGWNDYFDDYLRPRTFRYIQDLTELGIIAPDRSLYRTDLGGDPGAPSVGGVVVSHAHMDHAGFLGLLKPEIPILASPESHAILGSIQATGGGSMPENDFVKTKAKGKVGRTTTGALSTRARFDEGPRRSYATRPRWDDGNLSVTALPVDHSIPGAQAALVEWAGQSLAYSGDFRLHGRGRHKSEKLVERLGGVGVLLSEGTNVHGAHGHGKSTDKEEEVEATVDREARREEARQGRSGFIGVSYPPRDLDRFISLHAVAKRLGRRFAISTKQAHLLDALRSAGRDELPDPKTDRSLAVYFEAQGKGLLLEAPATVPVAANDLSVAPVDAQSEYGDLLESDYPEWARPYFSAPTRVGPLDVRKEPSAYLMGISYWSITELFDIFPDRSKANGLYIHSQTQPFNDDMLQDRRKLDRWLRAYNLDFAQTHVSGHLDEKSLDWVLDEIRPRTLVPIHSEHPEVTAQHYVANHAEREAVLAQPGIPLKLA